MIDVAIEAGELSRALRLIKGCILSRTTMPILQYALLKASAGQVSIFASSVDMEAEVVIPADVAMDGCDAVHSQMLSEITKSFPSAATATIAPDKAGKLLQFRSGKSRFNLAHLEPDTMPVMSALEVPSVRVKGSDLKWVLDTCGPCAAANGESQWMIAGVNLTVDGGKLYGIGSDGKRAAICTVDLIGEALPEGEAPPPVTIPNWAVKQVASICQGNDEISLALHRSRCEVRAARAVLRTRVIDAEFVGLSPSSRVKAEIPLFRAKANVLAETAERLCSVFAMVEAGSGAIASVWFGADGDEVIATAGGARGVNEATEPVEVDGLKAFLGSGGRFMQIGFVTRDLLPTLALFGDNEVQLLQAEPGGPVQVTSPAKPNLVCFLSPMTRR